MGRVQGQRRSLQPYVPAAIGFHYPRACPGSVCVHVVICELNRRIVGVFAQGQEVRSGHACTRLPTRRSTARQVSLSGLHRPRDRSGRASMHLRMARSSTVRRQPPAGFPSVRRPWCRMRLATRRCRASMRLRMACSSTARRRPPAGFRSTRHQWCCVRLDVRHCRRAVRRRVAPL